jgi:hypothetical protein
MAAELTVKLRISVWRDFVPIKSLTVRRDGETDHHLLASDAHLQQEVFSWQTREDAFAGVIDEETRIRLHEKLLERFDPSRPPADRRVNALRDFIDEANNVIEAGRSEWTISQDPPVDDEDAPFTQNSLLALKLHLEWLMDVFYERPGVSVSVR